MSPSQGLSFRPEELTSEVARGLIGALNAELSARYPEEGATHFNLDTEEVQDGRGAFLVGYTAGEAVACGAIRGIDSGTGELKRMYVVPGFRGRGFGRLLLEALETAAVGLGLARIVLETGTRQTAALALYERQGFQRIPAFGEYVGAPLSVCMEKSLKPPPAP